MRALIPLLWIAGAVQIAIAFANFPLAKKLRYTENLKNVAPIIRQIFLVHSAYIVGVVLFFAALSFGFAGELASGHGLGRFLAGSMAAFWLARIPLQIFFYDPAMRRAHRIGDLAMTLALLFLSATYAAAALAPRY